MYGRCNLKSAEKESVFLEVKPAYQQTFFICYLYTNPSAGDKWYNDFIMMDRNFTEGKEMMLLEILILILVNPTTVEIV